MLGPSKSGSLKSPRSELSSSVKHDMLTPNKMDIIKIRNITIVKNMYLASNHPVFEKNKKKSKNASENGIGQIKILNHMLINHLSKEHQVSMNMIHSIKFSSGSKTFTNK